VQPFRLPVGLQDKTATGEQKQICVRTYCHSFPLCLQLGLSEVRINQADNDIIASLRSCMSSQLPTEIKRQQANRRKVCTVFTVRMSSARGNKKKGVGGVKERPVAKTRDDQLVARRRQCAAGFTC
jgi:hypothetical protein